MTIKVVYITNKQIGDDIMQSDIRNILRELSITGNYKGYVYILTACELILEDETRLHSIMRDVYFEVAKIHGCKVQNIERTIRTVIFHVWKNQRVKLCKIAGYTLLSPPKVSEFLSIIVNYIRVTAA